MLLEEFDEERAIKNWNYTVNKLQVENEQCRNEIEQYHNEIEEYHNKLTNVCSENDKFRSENRKNIMQTVSLLREIGKDDDFIIKALIDKYNIPKDNVSSYL